MKFCIRVDDLGWNLDKSPDMCLQFARKFHEAMAGVPYLGAVIPYCLDKAGQSWLQSEPTGLTVAMHGFRHEPYMKGEPSEFYGCTLSKCKELIHIASLMLGIETRHFVAPWNHYTDDLHEALAAEGFDLRWMGPEAGSVPPLPEFRHYLRIPAWRRLDGAFRWRMGPEDEPLLEILSELTERPGQAVISLHVTWEGSKGDDFRGVREFVQKYGDAVITPDQYLKGK